VGSALKLAEAGMTDKPMSWIKTALIFGAMATCTFGLDMVFSPSLRHQVWSIHSNFWEIAIPGDLIGDAVIAMAMRVAVNWHLRSRNRTNLETHRIS